MRKESRATNLASENTHFEYQSDLYTNSELNVSMMEPNLYQNQNNDIKYIITVVDKKIKDEQNSDISSEYQLFR